MKERFNKKTLFLIILLLGLISACVILFTTIIFKNINNGNKNNSINDNIVKENKNESINEIKNLEGLTFESTKIVYKNGMSTLTTKITNNNSEDYIKENFRIIIKDKENRVIVDLTGFMYGGLKANETRLIASTIDLDLSSNAYYIEYEEVE